jgi:ABC-type glycerol-3-phosphate transport system substrate-binding protein
MKQMQTPLMLMIAGTVVAAACVIAAPSASAQDATMSTTDATTTTDPASVTADSADAFTVAPPQTFSASGKPTSSTPQLVQEAIQRSQARSEKLRTQNVPERWGSEEPFTFNPAVR